MTSSTGWLGPRLPRNRGRRGDKHRPDVSFTTFCFSYRLSGGPPNLLRGGPKRPRRRGRLSRMAAFSSSLSSPSPSTSNFSDKNARIAFLAVFLSSSLTTPSPSRSAAARILRRCPLSLLPRGPERPRRPRHRGRSSRALASSSSLSLPSPFASSFSRRRARRALRAAFLSSSLTAPSPSRSAAFRMLRRRPRPLLPRGPQPPRRPWHRAWPSRNLALSSSLTSPSPFVSSFSRMRALRASRAAARSSGSSLPSPSVSNFSRSCCRRSGSTPRRFLLPSSPPARRSAETTTVTHARTIGQSQRMLFSLSEANSIFRSAQLSDRFESESSTRGYTGYLNRR